METFAHRLQEVRINAGMDSEEAAKKLHVTKQILELWEAGSEEPSLEQLRELAKLYRVTTDWLLSGKKTSVEVEEVTSNLSDRMFCEVKMAAYVNAYCTAKHLYQTMQALAFAKEKHRGQFRKPGHSTEKIPYISHPLTMTCHALALGLEDDDLLSACLLHDVCEDCDVEIEELPVNERTKEAVRLLTKPENFTRSEEDETQYYGRIGENPIALMVKLLDRCNNISCMATSFSDKWMAEYIKETQDYIKPLLNKARKEYPEYTNQLFLIRYHMNSVLEALKHHMLSNLRNQS